MKNSLSHLSDIEVQELIKRYYQNEKVQELLSEYDINTKPSKLVHLFPPKKIDANCAYCDANLVIEYKSRNSYHNKNAPICPLCRHTNETTCDCINCMKANHIRIQTENSRKQEFLDSALNINCFDRIDLNTLSFEEKIYLGAFLREGISEDFNYIKPIETSQNPLAPTPDFSSEISNLLIEKKIIVIHPESDVSCFTNIDIENEKYSYYPSKVKWALNIQKDELSKIDIIESLINPNIEFDSEDAYILWRKISLYEALEYFYYSVNNILGVDYPLGDKTRSVLNDLLNNYSVSQIYTIIYRSTNNALRFKVEKGVSAKHAANTIIGSAQSFSEKAMINNWEVQRYNRLKECPESALSRFFFERILKIGFAGFNEKPRMII